MIGLLEIHDISIYSKHFEDIFGLNTLSLPETMISYLWTLNKVMHIYHMFVYC